jgi:hypothetical protein
VTDFLLLLERELEAAARRRIEARQRRRFPRPRPAMWRALAAAVVLVAAVAVAVVVLPSDSERVARPPAAASGRVLVLNGTDRAGLAGRALRRLDRAGISGRIGNWTSQQQTESVVFHVPQSAIEARKVAALLAIDDVRAGLPPEELGPGAGDVGVLVVIGADAISAGD